MTDINEYIYPILDDLFNTELVDWEYVIVEIECNANYVGTSVKYLNSQKICISDNEKSLSPKSKISLIQMYNVMKDEPKIFEKWNKANLSCDKNGKYDISFAWNQDLQDKWDSAL